MIRDPEHGNQAYEDGEDWREASSLAHIAYADWRGPTYTLTGEAQCPLCGEQSPGCRCDF